MCMYDDSDPVTLLGESDPKARKEHKCGECRRVIKPGEQYHVDRYVFEGEMKAHKTCAHCMVVRNWLGAECGGWAYGAIEEDAREHVSEGYGHGMPLARMVVAMGNDWARRDGSLRPVPAMLTTTHQKQSASK